MAKVTFRISPIGKLADRIGPRLPVLGGLLVYACSLLLLSGITAVSAVPDAVAAILIMAVGMAIFSAPLAAVTMSAVDETDQGVASAVNNVTGQLAGLLAVVLLPAAAGLAGVRFSDPRFALGYGQALLVPHGSRRHPHPPCSLGVHCPPVGDIDQLMSCSSPCAARPVI